MKTFLRYFLPGFFLVLAACSNPDTKPALTKFSLEPLAITTAVKLSDLGFSNIEYIPLETTAQSVIHRSFSFNTWDRLLIDSTSVIIKQFANILKFRSDGSFVRQIGTIGRGPNEFTVCNDIDGDPLGRIYIFDCWKKKMFVYSKSGDFIKIIPIPLSGLGEFRIIGWDFLFYSDNHLGNVTYSYCLIDTCGNLVRKYGNKYPFKKIINGAYGFSHENLFYSHNGYLFTKEVYSDTVFKYENQNFIPYIKIISGNKRITPEARATISGLELAKKYISPTTLFEFGNFIYYQFTYSFDFSNTIMFGYLASRDGKFQAVIDPVKGIKNDLDGGPDFLPIAVKDNNTVVGLVEAIDLKRLVASEEFKNS
jgi:hypothetical protein